MAGRELKNKPLVEAILELKWQLEPQADVAGQQATQTPASNADPHYKLLLGRLYDRLIERYPHHEPLHTSNFPDELVKYLVQYRFRARKDGWPLVQIGPGILSVNDTDGYTWTDFEERCNQAVDKLFDAHPKPQELKVQSLVLRYIDAVQFDYLRENAFDFLRDKLKVCVELPDGLFESTGVKSLPLTTTWHAAFGSESPAGVVELSFATGRKNDVPAIVWQTTFQTTVEHLPSMPSGFSQWLGDAHSVTHDWFFKLIAGDLERRFEGV